MNIRTNDSGYVTNEHILKSGFKVDEEHVHSDMGQGSFTLKDFSKDGKLFLTGGYWNYYIKDKDGNLLFEGWWNSNEEFDNTIRELEKKIE